MQEVNFDLYTENGVIEEHYPLHNSESLKEIDKSNHKYMSSLVHMITAGDKRYHKYLEPIHLMKSYYGERMTFFFMYMVHY